MKKQQKFRASFSVLDAWAKKDYEQAVRLYFKLDCFENEAMRQGKEFHNYWEKETKETGCLPEIFGGMKLKNPKTELKMVVSVNDWLDFVGVIDCYDNPTIYEYKTGISSSSSYARSKQIGLYGILGTLMGLYVEKAEILHYNQYSKLSDVSIVWLTDKVLRDAYDWLETHASEMHNYLLENDLYNKLSKKDEEGK